MSVSGRVGNACRVAAGSKLMSMVSMASAARAWRASAGFMAAASDPEIAALLDEISAARLKRMTVNARGLSDAGHLRARTTPGEAADIMWAYTSPELYELLVIRRGWPPERFGQFVGQALITALLPAQDT